MKLTLLYKRRWWLFYLPVLLCTVVALWWSATVWQPLPPRQLVLSAGSPQGSYARLARRYAEELEREGLRVRIVYNTTTAADLLSIADEAPATAAVGFAQGSASAATSGLQTLAVIGLEPMWVFSAATGTTSLAQTRGQRLVAGPRGSPSWQAAEAMLAQAGLAMKDMRLEMLSTDAAANALLDGRLDLLIEAAGEDEEAVQRLTRSSAVQLLGTDQAGALATRNPTLQPLLLPQGAIEVRGDIPPRDLTLMSLQTHLLVRPGVHPALQREVLDAAVRILERPGFLQRHGQFPSFRNTDFPLSPTARAYDLGERPWLENLLPYRKAQWAALMLYAVLPIVLIAFLLLAWVPRLFDWRINSALHNFYGELKFLEVDIDQALADQPMQLRRLLERLDQIEKQVIGMDLPGEFSERWYTLREHLAAARERLLTLRAR